MQSSEGYFEEVASECSYEDKDGKEDGEDTSNVGYNIDDIIEPPINMLSDGASLNPEIGSFICIVGSPSILLCWIAVIADAGGCAGEGS